MKLAVTGVCLAALLALPACDPNTGRPPPKVVQGALIGTTVGALGGLLVGGNDRRNALVGAGIGLVAGALIGKYLDDQERALQEDLRGTGALVVRKGDRLVVTLPEAITFAVDSHTLSQQSRRVVSQLAKSLNRYPNSYVDVIGHTDSSGDRAYNQQLSERRALAVANALVRRSVNPARIESAGVGETQPVASNASPGGRAQNRRVEVYVIPAS
jgi:outer membrane protein OmpA-like peptidoglycan-associated protein